MAKYKDNDKVIKSCDKKETVTLEEYLKSLTITFEHQSNTCKMFSESDIYLLINATSNNKITTYKIPITIKSCN